MADLDEEIRRQAAIASLLSRDDSGDSYAASMAPEVIQPDTQEEYHKLVNQAFDTAKPPDFETKTDEPTWHVGDAREEETQHPIASDQPEGPPKLAPTPIVPGLVTDPESGSRYVKDPSVDSGVVPYAEPATPADEAAFKPGDVTLPKSEVLGPAPRAQLVDPDPDKNVFELNRADQPIPGFVPGSKNAIVNPAAGVVPPTPRPAYPDRIVSPEEASGTRSIVNATAAPVAPAAVPAASAKVTGGEGFWGGDLTQGPPGTKPNGTEDEPYWPKSDKDVALLPPGANYIDPKDQSQKVTPGAPAAQPTNVPAGQPEVTQPKTTDDYNKLMDSWFPSADTKAKADVTASAEPMLNAPNGQAPAALIIHHTGGNNSAQSVVDDWHTNRPGVGAQMIMDRDGTIHYTQKEFGYNGTGNFLHSVIPGVSNQTAVGIEVIAKDDADMTPAQLASLQRLAGPKGPYANVAVYGHSQVSPGDRDNEGVRGVNAINEARSGAAPTGEPGTTPIETLVKLDQSGLNVTHFGYEKPGESGYDVDSANGNGRYVKDLVPGYDVALNSAGAAMVGNPKPGETFTFAGKEFRYGDAVSEKLTDPRFDIYDPSGTALTGSMPVGRQVAASTPAQNKMPWDDWTPLSPADQAAAEKEGLAFRTQQVSSLDKLNRATPNPKQFWETLQNPIEGVTDSQRQAYAENFKKEVTAHAQDFYGEKDPEKAFTKAISDPGLEAYITNIGRGLAGAVGEADIGIALAGKSIDRNRADGFMNLVHPDSTGEGRAAFLKNLTDIQDIRHRHDVFNEIYGSLPQNTKDAIGDPASILDSIDHLANPAEQADLNKRIATKKAWVDQQLAGSPELKGTSAGWWTTGTGENLFNTVAALIPGGVGAVVRTSTLGAQMYSSNMDRIAQENPSWSGEKVSDEASKSAFMTLAPSEAVLALSHGLTAPILKWAGSLAEKPIVRFGIGGGVQVAAAGVGGALGQVGTNVAENKDLLKDVPQAAGSAIVQSLPFAVHGGVGALGHELAPVEHAAPVEPVPSAEPARTEPAPLRPVAASEMLGPDVAQAPAPRVFTSEQEAYNKWFPNEIVQGQDPLVIRGAERNWSPQELSEVIQKFPSATPEQLREILETQSPASLHLEGGFERSAAGSKRGPRWEPQPANLEVEQTRQSRVNQPPITPTELLTRRAPVDLNTAIAQQRAAAALGGQLPPVRPARPAPPIQERPFVPSGQYQEVPDHVAIPPGAEIKMNMATGKNEARWTGEVPGPEKVIDKRTGKPQSTAVPEPPPVHVSESEPFTSKIANRYTADRMASGELGHVDPSQGKSTEELIKQGVQMSPDQRERLINNFTRGVGGDLDNQGAAIRSKEAILSMQSSEASRAAEANPTNQQLKAEAEAALKAVTDFHNGPVKKFKRVWSDSGRGLQREIPLDYATLNGMKEAYMKGQGNGKAAPPEMEPALKKTAARVKKSASDEEAAINNLGEEIGKRTRGKPLPNDDSIRAKLMKIMGDLPCRN